MKAFPLISSILTIGLTLSTPTLVFGHVGHGDEFQATGGIERVQVNPETDPMLGIIVNPIAPAPNGSSAVMIPVTALVDADGKQLVFVQYENFYEPVEVTTGATQGEMIEVTKGLSVGEKLVTQGSLSLYAESRKTQTVETVATSEQIDSSDSTAQTHAQVDAQGIPHSHDTSGNLVSSGEATATEQPSEFPLVTVAAIGGGTALLLGGLSAIAFMGGSRQKKRLFSNKKGGL